MPSRKSAFKRLKTDEKKRLINKNVKSSVKTYVKKVLTAIEQKDIDAVKTLLPIAHSKLDKAGKKYVLHRNTVSRKKSKLEKKASAFLSESK
ncbi:30S ribosomal protein S20 [bacterium]|nr:30S ribosomal protein S20 [bacterium]